VICDRYEGLNSGETHSSLDDGCLYLFNWDFCSFVICDCFLVVLKPAWTEPARMYARKQRWHTLVGSAGAGGGGAVGSP